MGGGDIQKDGKTDNIICKSRLKSIQQLLKSADNPKSWFLTQNGDHCQQLQS